MKSRDSLCLVPGPLSCTFWSRWSRERERERERVGVVYLAVDGNGGFPLEDGGPIVFRHLRQQRPLESNLPATGGSPPRDAFVERRGASDASARSCCLVVARKASGIVCGVKYSGPILVIFYVWW